MGHDFRDFGGFWKLMICWPFSIHEKYANEALKVNLGAKMNPHTMVTIWGDN